MRPVWLLVLRCTYLLYFAATLLVYRFADRACALLSCCSGLLQVQDGKALAFLVTGGVHQALLLLAPPLNSVLSWRQPVAWEQQGTTSGVLHLHSVPFNYTWLHAVVVVLCTTACI